MKWIEEVSRSILCTDIILIIFFLCVLEYSGLKNTRNRLITVNKFYFNIKLISILQILRICCNNLLLLHVMYIFLMLNKINAQCI